MRTVLGAFSFVAILTALLAIPSGAFAEDLIDDLSTLGKSCTSRSFVSGTVPIDIRVRSSGGKILAYASQYYDGQDKSVTEELVLTDPSTDLYTVSLDTTKLANNWANIMLISGSAYSVVYLYINNSSRRTDGKAFSIATSQGSSPAPSEPAPAPIEPTPKRSEPAPTPEPTPIQKACKGNGKRCR